MLGAVISKLKVGLLISRDDYRPVSRSPQSRFLPFYSFTFLLFSVEVGRFISRDRLGEKCSHFERVGSALASSARCRRIKYKAWGNAPGNAPQMESALQAQQ